ncbi:MAG: ECF transporter S component [Oscillospiraceae bacterium]
MRTKKIVYGGLLIALGIILPQLFHVFGQTAGQTFLPMHIPVLLAGLLIGPYWGMCVAIAAPILSSLITGMPPVPMLYFMLLELVVYAVISGLLSGKINIYLNLIITLICGRIVYGLSLVAAVNLFGMTFKFANTAAFFGGILTGLPGIIIQLVFIPIIMYALKKGGLTLAKQTR